MPGPVFGTGRIEVDVDASGVPRQVQNTMNTLNGIIVKEMKNGGSKGGEGFGDEFDKSTSGRFRKITSKLHKELEGRFEESGGSAGGKWSNGFSQGLFSGMDRTVALVIKLIASIGPQLAALGSALSANLVALLSSSLIGLGGALVSLGGPLTAAGLAAALAVSGFKEMRAALPGLEENITKLGDAWDRQAQAFGAQWGPALSNFLGLLRQAMDASSFGTALGKSIAEITNAFAGVLSSPGFIAFRTALETTFPAALTSFGTGLASFASGLLQIFASAGPLAEQLGQKFADMGTRFQEAVDKMAADGRLEAFFARAGDSFSALMGVLGPLSKALGNVFLAGQDSGDNLLGILGDLAQRFEDWTSSIEGQDALATWFSQSEGIFASLLDLIGSVGTTLADMVTPATLAQVDDFLQALEDIIPILGEVLSAVGAADMLNILANAILGILTALEPALPALQSLASLIGSIPADVIQTIAVALAGVAAAFALLAGIGVVVGLLTGAISVMGTLATIAPVLAIGLKALGAVIAVLGGPITAVIAIVAALVAGLVYFFTQTETGKKAWSSFVTWLQGLWQGLVDWFTGTFLPAIQGVWDGLVAGVQAVGDWFGDVWQGILDAPQNVLNWFTGTFVPFMQSLPGLLLTALIEYVQFWISLPGRIIGALATLIAFLIQWGADVATSMIAWVSDMIPKVIQFFADLPGNIIAAVDAFGAMLLGWITDAWNAMYDFVVNAAIAYIDFWLRLPSRVVEAVSSLVGALVTWSNEVWDSLKATTSAGIDAVVAFFKALPGKVVSALGSLLGTVGRIFTDAMGEGNRAALEGIGKLLDTVGKIPGQILSAVGNLAKTLYGAGRDVVQGLVDGVASMAGAVGREVNKIISGLSAGVKKLLGISSPSKVFADIGRNVMLGLQGGITANASGPLGAMGDIASALTNQIGPVGNPGFGGVSGANANAGVSRTVSVASGAIVVNVPTDNPEQAANAVLDRLVARWK